MKPLQLENTITISKLLISATLISDSNMRTKLDLVTEKTPGSMRTTLRKNPSVRVINVSERLKHMGVSS